MDTQNAAFLKEEYFHLNKTVEDFDQKALTIKAWSVTVSMAGIVTAFTQEIAMLFIFAGVSSLLFWIIEALWKSFQQAYYNRIREIEAFFAGKQETTHFQINSSWSKAWHACRAQKFGRIMTWPHVFLPHAIIALGGPCLWLMNTIHPFVP